VSPEWFKTNCTCVKPTLILAGYRWFDRVWSAMLSTVRVHELIATTDENYMKKLIRLLDEAECT